MSPNKINNEVISIMRNIVAVACVLGFFFSSFCVFGAEDYVALNPTIAKKCGITFVHPRYWKMYYLGPDFSADQDAHCIIAYRNLKMKKPEISVPMVETWREFANGGFVVKNTPVMERLAEFDFKVDENGKVKYVGEEYTKMAAEDGYSPATIDSEEITQQGGGTLYIGREHSTQTKKSKGKVVYKNTRDIDLLFGNKSMSVGDSSSESDTNSELRGYNAIYEKVYKSMKFIENTK